MDCEYGNLIKSVFLKEATKFQNIIGYIKTYYKEGFLKINEILCYHGY